MTDPKDKDPKATGNNEQLGSAEKRSGRVGFDERGNSVWEWQLETGVYSRDVNTQKLKKLNLDELSIADTAVNKKPSGFTPDAKPETGFNPYNSSRQVGGGSSPYDTARAMGDKLRDKPKEPDRPRTPADMRKLSEAIKRQKEKDGKG